MTKKFCVFALVLLLAFSMAALFIQIPRVKATSLYEYYNTGDNAYTTVGGDAWTGESFTAVNTHNVTAVRLKMYRLIASKTVTVELKATDAYGYPTGSALASSTMNTDDMTTDTNGAWYFFNFSTPITVSLGTKYAIITYAVDSSTFRIRREGPAGNYADGEQVVSSDGGVSWSSSSADVVFEVWGTIADETLYSCSLSSNPEINAKVQVNSTQYSTPTTIYLDGYYVFTAESAKMYGANGYSFDHWLVNGTTEYYTQTLNLDITGNTNLSLYYTIIPNLYYLYGPYDEETGYLLDENVTVTVFHIGGIPPYTMEFNGTWAYPFESNVQYFRFNFTNNSTREYWVDPSEGVQQIYIFKADTTEYTINFLDTTGILSRFPYVTIKRYVNGTLYTVEKRKVDAYKSIIANLVMTRTYQIILGNEQTTYVWGDLTMTAQTAIQLTLRGVDFPKETLFVQKYLRIYGYRNTSTSPETIVIIYEDTKLATSSVDIYINYGNLTNVDHTIIYANSFVFEWNDALHGVDYQVTVEIHHGKYGDLTWKQFFVGGFSEPPFSLAFLGDWGFDSSFLFPALLILCAAGCFSKLNAEVGALLMTITAIILTWMGWIPIPAGMLVAAITLSILMALIYAKRRVTIY